MQACRKLTISGLLISVALLCATLAGYMMSKRRSRSWPHLILYPLVVSATIYVLLDLDDPRSGMIRLDRADAVLSNLQHSIR